MLKLKYKKVKTTMKSYLFRFALLVFAVYLVGSCVKLQIELVDEKQELREQIEENTEIELEIERLSNLIENGDDADFIEAAARERLGYVFPDEEVYKSVSGN